MLIRLLTNKTDLTSLSLIKSHQSTIDSSSRLHSQEEMQLAAMYAYHPSQIPSPINKIEDVIEKPAPSFNTTETLEPPPTDAQIIRANLRRANVLHFEPRRQRKRRHPRRHSAFDAMPRLDEQSTDIDFSKPMRRRSLTPMVAQTPHHGGSYPLQGHSGRLRRHSSVLELKNFMDSPTIAERPGTATSLSSISTFHLCGPSVVASSDIIAGQSPDASPSLPKPKPDTLRIPEKTLKSYGGLLFDIDGPYKGKMYNWPASPDREKAVSPDSAAARFFDPLAIDVRAPSPVTKYIQQQHSILQTAIAHDQERMRRSLDHNRAQL